MTHQIKNPYFVQNHSIKHKKQWNDKYDNKLKIQNLFMLKAIILYIIYNKITSFQKIKNIINNIKIQNYKTG